MNNISKDPWAHMDTFFDDIIAHRHIVDKETPYKLRVDVIDQGDHCLFVTELPGIAKENIDVKMQNGMLTIDANTGKSQTSETEHILRQERRLGFFSRSFSIGGEVNAGEIQATVSNGLLKLTVPVKMSTATAEKSGMNVIPRDPWYNVDTFFDDLFVDRHLFNKEAPHKPRVDIIDRGDNYLFVAELPGIAKESINVNTQGGILTIEAETDKEELPETEHIIRQERRSGTFSRSIDIGEELDEDNMKAEFSNGLLKLTMTKQTATTITKEVHKIDIS